jgi:hypothetical protein
MIPTDGQTTLMEVARRLRVRYLVMPGAFRRTYPGFQEALDREQIAAVREMPTLAAYAGLQIFDLQAGPLLAEGRRLNQAGRDAARRGDYAEAEARFEAALKLLAEYPRPAEVLRKNLAQARAAARAGVPR